MPKSVEITGFRLQLYSDEFTQSRSLSNNGQNYHLPYILVLLINPYMSRGVGGSVLKRNGKALPRLDQGEERSHIISTHNFKHPLFLKHLVFSKFLILNENTKEEERK